MKNDARPEGLLQEARLLLYSLRTVEALKTVRLGLALARKRERVAIECHQALAELYTRAGNAAGARKHELLAQREITASRSRTPGVCSWRNGGCSKNPLFSVRRRRR